MATCGSGCIDDRVCEDATNSCFCPAPVCPATAECGEVTNACGNTTSCGMCSGGAFCVNSSRLCSFPSFAAADNDPDDRFGYSVAAATGFFVVGAPYDQERGPEAGAAYVFEFVPGTGWVQQKILAADVNNSNHFGISVATDGTRIAVGADQEESGGSNRGAVYVFERNQTTGKWEEQQELDVPGAIAADDDYFGRSVAIDGDRLIAGSPGEDFFRAASNRDNAGSAHIFEYNSTLGTWQWQVRLRAGDADSNDRYGTSVDLDGATAIVGSPGSAPSGAVYVYTKRLGLWQESRLASNDSNGMDLFGAAVSLDGTTMLVGAPDEDDGAGNIQDAGAAYRYDGLSLSNEVKHQASDKQADDFFGSSVDILGDAMVVGAPQEDQKGGNAGAAYLYVQGASTFPQTETLKLVADNGNNDDLFGFSVSLNNNIVLVGAPEQGPNKEGRVYLFKIP
jgi:hypothetical protein